MDWDEASQSQPASFEFFHVTLTAAELVSQSLYSLPGGPWQLVAHWELFYRLNIVSRRNEMK